MRNETWLKKTTPSSKQFITNLYNVYRKGKNTYSKDKSHGGEF